MIWSPYAIRRAVHAFNKNTKKTMADRMVSALNEAARIHGLKTVDDELINELLDQIKIYEQTFQEYEKKIEKTKNNRTHKEQQLVNKCAKLQRQAGAVRSLFGELKSHLKAYDQAKAHHKRENALNSIFRIIEIDSNRAFEAWDEREKETLEYISSLEGETNDMHHGP